MGVAVAGLNCSASICQLLRWSYTFCLDFIRFFLNGSIFRRARAPSWLQPAFIEKHVITFSDIIL